MIQLQEERPIPDLKKGGELTNYNFFLHVSTCSYGGAETSIGLVTNFIQK